MEMPPNYNKLRFLKDKRVSPKVRAQIFVEIHDASAGRTGFVPLRYRTTAFSHWDYNAVFAPREVRIRCCGQLHALIFLPNGKVIQANHAEEIRSCTCMNCLRQHHSKPGKKVRVRLCECGAELPKGGGVTSNQAMSALLSLGAQKVEACRCQETIDDYRRFLADGSEWRLKDSGMNKEIQSLAKARRAFFTDTKTRRTHAEEDALARKGNTSRRKGTFRAAVWNELVNCLAAPAWLTENHFFEEGWFENDFFHAIEYSPELNIRHRCLVSSIIPTTELYDENGKLEQALVLYQSFQDGRNRGRGSESMFGLARRASVNIMNTGRNVRYNATWDCGALFDRAMKRYIKPDVLQTVDGWEIKRVREAQIKKGVLEAVKSPAMNTLSFREQLNTVGGK